MKRRENIKMAVNFYSMLKNYLIKLNILILYKRNFEFFFIFHIIVYVLKKRVVGLHAPLCHNDVNDSN
jgi:hypothetical protein